MKRSILAPACLLVLFAVGCSDDVSRDAPALSSGRGADVRTVADAVEAAGQGGEAKIDFAREVLPILSDNCYACHGPDQDSKEASKAGFRLDDREEALDFEMIVPGDPDASPLIDVITTKKSSRLMPPPKSGKPRLTPEQVDTLRRWIAQGAEYTDHWAFVKPVKSELPAVPNRADPAWATNEIDRFIQAKLHEQGLAPNEPADRNRLIRRLYLDLIGLPPTPQQAQAFVNNPSPDAYEGVVDELLASPRFGEHWARQWLDKARYADSKGFAADRFRTMWRYRDWVIEAYNHDLPFDQFTIEQLAGDLLDNPTLEQRIATGFHRNTMTNDEGGTDDEEFRAAAVIDRVNTTGEVWLGLTMACAQCHTHKYDPIFHDEYFQFYAFFNQTADTDRLDDEPRMRAPTTEQQVKLTHVRQKRDRFAVEIAPERRTLIDERQNKKHERKRDKNKNKNKRKDKDQAEPLELSSDEARYVRLDDQYRGLMRKAPFTLVMQELPADQHRETYLFKGGSFLAPDKAGGLIEPGTPDVLHPFPPDAPKNRLGLAQWLVHEDNPLTARVQANRIWEQIWGVGLVETTEDFGLQASYPSNKPLLDYLAVTYQQDFKWSTKSLIKMIVMSSAYRQNALHTAEKLEADPFNRLMSRGPRLRLSAEQIRDQALAIAGLLNVDHVGGPSVTPYLPGGILGQSFGNIRQQESKGEDLYRRGVYTFWRRSAHYASFAVFDAPSREICTAKRSRTNTPLQAFVTLNDRAYVEAAQGLGRRLIKEVGGDIDARLKLGMQYALARDPSSFELDTLREVYDESLTHYQANAQAAIDIATQPAGPLPEGMDAADAAAMTMVGNVLLNLDELINKP